MFHRTQGQKWGGDLKIISTGTGNLAKTQRVFCQSLGIFFCVHSLFFSLGRLAHLDALSTGQAEPETTNTSKVLTLPQSMSLSFFHSLIPNWDPGTT